MNLTGFALRNQPLVMMIVTALVVYAVSVMGDFPSQEDPPITVRDAVVTTFVPGMELEDVELLVTRTIEKALARIPERDYIYSWSRHGYSEVRIKVLDRYEEADLDIIWQDVRNKVIDATPTSRWSARRSPEPASAWPSCTRWRSSSKTSST
jgi:multidrug efflux pump subunit AcrB